MGHTLTEPIAFDFKTGISPDKAERIVAALGAEEHPIRNVVLSFKDYPYVNAGVAWRIGNALRRYSGGAPDVEVPPFAEGQGRWFQSFSRSALGDAIVAHAARVTSGGEDITEQIKRYYSQHTERQSQNSVLWGELHRGISVNPEREDQFREQLLKSLKYVNVRPTHFNPERLQDLIKLVFEAIQNVYDHAKRRPLPSETKIVSYCLLRYYNKIQDNHPDPQGRLKAYTTRLPTLTNRIRTDFIEICVNDDGVGIAARQAQDPSIYWGAKSREEEALREALKARSSVKLRAQDTRVRGTPGQGYTYIDASLRSLRAYAVLRTGRLLAVLDGTNETGEGFTLLNEELGYMPGTTLDIIVPILKDGDGLPALFADE